MLQVYVSNVLSVSDVCCIQVFHVSCCLESQRRWGIGRAELVADGRGVRHAGDQRSGVRLWGRGERIGMETGQATGQAYR
jgi:hypothetical protein